MSETVIAVEDLSKQYRLGVARHDTFRDRITHAFRSSLRRNESAPDAADFWALQGVSFEVKRGEVLGIIGLNGAGKSTLLKVLSRITEPTKGRITIRGRVASLLEVGTGFHPELTGRENIFLNGAILGMTRDEIRRSFDAIVAFAEVERFLDTPVKHYSSGMYVRLAFAVAAHLEPEILIVDEVLAVGDNNFQKKCLGKMREVSASSSRTVLFVSHNLQAVQQLCSRAILLEAGRLVHDGVPSATLARYAGSSGRGSAQYALDRFSRAVRPEAARFVGIAFTSDAGAPLVSCARSEKIHLTVTFNTARPITDFDLAIAVVQPDGTRLFSELWSDGGKTEQIPTGDHRCRFRIAARYFKAGSHSLALAILEKGSLIDFVEDIPLPDITDPTADPLTESHRWGVVRIPVEWTSLE
jgi:lipopolysaccharide transport system ATP-binding protein